MKRMLALILVLVWALVGLPMYGQAIKPPKGFDGKLWNGTLVLYGARGEDKRALCTATPYEKIPGGYHLITAGHCIQGVPEDIKFSVADNIGDVLTPVTVVKARREGNMDFAELELKTTKKYPTVVLGDEYGSRVGDKVVNPNFALAVAKQISHGVISSQIVSKNPDCPDGCRDGFIVQMYGALGSSGSVVISEKTHQVIGICVWSFDGDIGLMTEPISRFYKFLSMPTQPHPKAQAEADDDSPAALTIPDADFQKLFGKDHPFMLTEHGPDPQFTQENYIFRVPTLGMELSDEYYYDVPVYIAVAENGEYRLTSTKGDGPSVTVVVIGAPQVHR